MFAFFSFDDVLLDFDLDLDLGGLGGRPLGNFLYIYFVVLKESPNSFFTFISIFDGVDKLYATIEGNVTLSTFYPSLLFSVINPKAI